MTGDLPVRETDAGNRDLLIRPFDPDMAIPCFEGVHRRVQPRCGQTQRAACLTSSAASLAELMGLDVPLLATFPLEVGVAAVSARVGLTSSYRSPRVSATT